MLENLNKTPAVKHLLFINIGVFLAMNFVPQVTQYYDTLALHYFDTPEFSIWQMVSHMFMHAQIGSPTGIFHIIFNMFMLFQFGAVLEQRWGTSKFLLFYFVAGIGGAIFYTLNLSGIVNYLFHTITPISEGLYNGGLPTAVGASAAITGIVVAFAYLQPNTKLMLMFIPVPIKAKYLVGAFLVYDLVAGILNTLGTLDIVNIYRDNTAHFAHLGGAVFGGLLLLYWQKNSHKFY
jgi:membrane associated rhomboid family serine protease